MQRMRILLNGETLISGDDISVRVIMNNLSGRNFNRYPTPASAHQDYLDLMTHEFGCPHPLGASLVLIDADSRTIDTDTIGGSLNPLPVAA